MEKRENQAHVNKYHARQKQKRERFGYIWMYIYFIYNMLCAKGNFGKDILYNKIS